MGGANEMTRPKDIKTLNWINRLDPFYDESLAGFVGRWARVNALSSRLNLLTSIGISRAIRLLPSDIIDLSRALGVAQSALELIAPSSNPKFPVLRRGHTRPVAEAVCPACLVEASYSRQLWSHVLATACPKHGVRLLDHCQKCGGNLHHDRQLPHLCGCGTDLRNQQGIQASPAEVDFATMLTGNSLISEALPFDLTAGIPPDLDLAIWGMANHFGINTTQSKVGKSPIPKTVDQAVAKLAPLFELMSDWPNRFDEQLGTMLSLTRKNMSTGAAARAGRWYFLLFRKYAHLKALEPIRIATANAIVKSHDGLLNRRTSSVMNIATIQKEWYSVKEAAIELRVSADRINDGIDRCLIHAQVHDEAVGYRQRFIALKEIVRLRQVQFEHINDTHAVAILQVPKSVFRLMFEAGWVVRADKNDVAPVVAGYIKHVPLLALIERLQSAARENAGLYIGSTVRLCDLNLRRTTDFQRLIGLFRAIAAGEILPVGHDENFTIGKISFSQQDVDKRIASWFVARGLTLEQVSDLIGAHYDAVKAWVDLGLLPATRDPLEHGSPWVVEIRELTSFLQTYVPLACQAKACQSSTRGLTERLKRRDIEPIEPPGGRGSLLKLSDVWKVI